MPTEPDTRLPLPPVLATKRLILRPMRLADAPSLQRRFNDWEVVKHLNAHVPWPYPDDGVEAHLRASLEKRDRYGWAITLKGADEDALGLISIRPDAGDESEMRGFWLGRDHWGRGLTPRRPSASPSMRSPTSAGRTSGSATPSRTPPRTV